MDTKTVTHDKDGFLNLNTTVDIVGKRVNVTMVFTHVNKYIIFKVDDKGYKIYNNFHSTENRYLRGFYSDHIIWEEYSDNLMEYHEAVYNSVASLFEAKFSHLYTIYSLKTGLASSQFRVAEPQIVEVTGNIIN